MEMEHGMFATKGQADAALATGITGTVLGGLSALGGIGSLAGAFGGNYGRGYGNYNVMPYQNAVPAMPYMMPFVTNGEMEHRLNDVKEAAAKDMKISELMSEKISDQKDIEVYKQVRTDINNALEPIKQDIRELQHQAKEQAVYNGVNTATIGCIRNQVDQLYGLAQLKIPNTSVCPGWGAVNVTPVTP